MSRLGLSIRSDEPMRWACLYRGSLRLLGLSEDPLRAISLPARKRFLDGLISASIGSGWGLVLEDVASLHCLLW